MDRIEDCIAFIVGKAAQQVGQGTDLLETRAWDDLAGGVIEASYS